MIQHFNVYWLDSRKRSHMRTVTGPARAGRLVTLIVMKGGEVVGVIDKVNDQ